MMGNFFNRMYYGKEGKEDYTRDDLPDNRWQLFFAMVRLNFGKLVLVNLLFVLFFLPTYVWVFVLNVPLLNEYLESGDAMMIQSVIVTTIYGLAPCILLLSPGVVGMTYITRNMARDENVWVWADFWYAIKSNWKQMLAMGLLDGFGLILIYVANTFYGAYVESSLIFLIPRILVGVVAILLLCMNLYVWPMMVTYELKFKDLIRNSAILTVARLPQTLFMLLISAILPALLLLSTSVYVYIACFVIYLFLGFAIWSMAINSITTAVFDRFINVRIKGARVNRGLSTAYDEYAAENADLDKIPTGEEDKAGDEDEKDAEEKAPDGDGPNQEAQ